MAKNIDLNKIKGEIESRKRERNMTQSSFGEQVNAAPKDVFLNGLLESLQTGRETAALNLLKTVDNKASIKIGEIPKHTINETSVQRRPIQMEEKQHSVEMSPERDEQLFHDIEKKRKSTLAESMEGYINPAGHRPTQVPLNEGTYQQPMLNEVYLAESVKRMVNNHLIENLGPVLEESIKSTIIEMYAVERINEVLRENKEFIKTVVIDTIKEIQARSKAKAQQ
jgi:hypothetical protein